MTEQLSHGRRVVVTKHTYDFTRPEFLRSAREYYIAQYHYHKTRLFACKERKNWMQANNHRQAVDHYRQLTLDAKKADKPTQYEIDNQARIKAQILTELQVLHGRV